MDNSGSLKKSEVYLNIILWQYFPLFKFIAAVAIVTNGNLSSIISYCSVRQIQLKSLNPKHDNT